jgi:hypothetical protein
MRSSRCSLKCVEQHKSYYTKGLVYVCSSQKNFKLPHHAWFHSIALRKLCKTVKFQRNRSSNKKVMPCRSFVQRGPSHFSVFVFPAGYAPRFCVPEVYACAESKSGVRFGVPLRPGPATPRPRWAPPLGGFTRRCPNKLKISW